LFHKRVHLGVKSPLVMLTTCSAFSEVHHTVFACSHSFDHLTNSFPTDSNVLALSVCLY